MVMPPVKPCSSRNRSKIRFAVCCKRRSKNPSVKRPIRSVAPE
jgi:hypothetical protein